MGEYADFSSEPTPVPRPEPAGHGMSVGRLEAFSDGVFAIVITLLVLDLPPAPKSGQYGQALGDKWPTYLAYLASFLVAGTIWLNHHATFRLVRHTTYRLQVLNLLMLLPISILPWPTSIMADAAAPKTKDAAAATIGDQRLAAIIYGVTMTLVALTFNVVWRYLRAHPELFHEWVAPELLVIRDHRYNLGLPAYPLLTVIGWFNLPVFLALNLVLAGVYLLPTPDMDA